MFYPLHDANPLTIVPYQRVTLALIALTVGGFLLQLSLPSQGLHWGLVPAALFGGSDPATAAGVPAPLTLITSLFLHGGFWHLAGNLLFLWIFGDNIEDATGHLRFLVFYLVCGIAAGLTHAALSPGETLPLVGASGAVSGVLGAYWVLYPRVMIIALLLGKFPVYLPAYLLLGVWIGLQVVSALSGAASNVAWWAHVGGFVAGAGLILVFRRPGIPLFAGPPARRTDPEADDP